MPAFRLACDPLATASTDFRPVGEALARGGLIAYPTDTFYGLGVDPRRPDAIEAIFRAKGRASDQAIPLIAASVDDVRRWFGELSPVAARLAARFWPGPLTLVIPMPSASAAAAVSTSGSASAAASGVTALPETLTGGLGTVAIRVPDHAVARAVAAAAGGVITSTSANRSGHPPLQWPDEVLWEMGEWLALIVDAGPTPGGAPSTLVDVTRAGPPTLLRRGLVPWERVLESLQ